MKKNSFTIISIFLLITAICGFVGSSKTITDSSYDILGYMVQDFESPTFPPTGWSVSSGSLWGRSTSCSGYGVGTASAKADFYSVSSGSQDLISITIEPTAGTDSLKFDHAYATYQTEVDQLEVYYSTNNGTSWVLIIQLTGGVNGPLVTAPPTTSSFVPSASQWATKSYGLPSGVNKIKFTATSAYGNNLYLDNVKIGSPFQNDVAVISIDAPGPGILPGTVTPKATVKNYGLLQQSFPVTFTISPGSYSNTQNVSNLAPGATQQLTFASTTLSTIGNYNIVVYSQLSTDQNKSNDTMKSTTSVLTTLRNVLLEYCTGTWCQWCPCGKTTALQLQSIYPSLVVLAYHGPANGSDPYSFFSGNAILSNLGFSGYPTGIIDRQNAPGIATYPTWSEYVTGRYTNASVTPIKIQITAKNYNTSTRQLDLSVNVTPDVTLTGQYKINYVITEDNLVYAQTGNTSCPGGSSYIHYWVVRTMANGPLGENVNSGTWNANQTITKTLSTTLDAAWIPANCYVQIFVYKDASPLNNAEIQQVVRASVTGPIGITGNGSEIPKNYELSQNYPNPFNPVTNIKFAVPKDGFATLKIYDITGREIATYLNEFINAGYYNAVIDGTSLTSGIYFYTLKINNFTDTKKMSLIK